MWFHVSFQVNKPYLPLASGEYSVGIGVMIIASFSMMVAKFMSNIFFAVYDALMEVAYKSSLVYCKLM